MKRVQAGGYVTPEIEIMAFAVEQGFAVSTIIDGWGDGEHVEDEI